MLSVPSLQVNLAWSSSRERPDGPRRVCGVIVLDNDEQVNECILKLFTDTMPDRYSLSMTCTYHSVNIRVQRVPLKDLLDPLPHIMAIQASHISFPVFLDFSCPRSIDDHPDTDRSNCLGRLEGGESG